MKKSKPPLFEKLSHSLEESSQISQELYKQYLKKHKRVLLLLEGSLGSGKTFFVRSLGEGLGIQSNINSPSFNLLNIYTGAGIKFFHYDLYRLRDSLELEELDFRERWACPLNETKNSAEKQILHLIEWPQLALPLIPEDLPTYRLCIQHIQQQDKSEETGKRLFQLYRREEA